MRLSIDIPSDLEPYLEASARLRNTSITNLVRKLVHVMLRDQMILAVLDDSNVVFEQRVTKASIVNEARRAKRDAVALAKTTHTKTQYNPPAVFKRHTEPKTREELRRELEQAVANTASLPVE